MKRLALLLVLLLPACDARTSEERLLDTAAEFLRASQERDYEAVWSLLSEDWEVVLGGAELPALWKLPVSGSRAVAWNGTPEQRFLRFCRAAGGAVPPRLADAAAAEKIGPPWLLPPDLLASLSLEGAEFEAVEAVVPGDAENMGRKVPATNVRVGVGNFDTAPWVVGHVSLTFVEEDGDWRFLESGLTLGSPSPQAEMTLARASSGVESVPDETGLVVNVLADGRIEVMENIVTLSELPALLGDLERGRVVARIEHTVPWRRAAEVLAGIAPCLDSGANLWLGAGSPEADAADGEAGPALSPTGRTNRRTHIFSFCAMGGVAMSFRTLESWLPVMLWPARSREGLVLVEAGSESPSPEDLERLSAVLAGLDPAHVLVTASPDAPWHTVVSAIDAPRAVSVACSEIRLALPEEGRAESGIRVNGVPLSELRDGERPALPDHPALDRVIRAGRE